MLVLSRRVGESVVIGEDIVVTVLEVKGDIVRVGVAAPRSVAVHRREVLEQIAETNRAAASPKDTVTTDLSRLLSGNGSS